MKKKKMAWRDREKERNDGSKKVERNKIEWSGKEIEGMLRKEREETEVKGVQVEWMDKKQRDRMVIIEGEEGNWLQQYWTGEDKDSNELWG
jgi:hypothetical protein